MQIPRSVTLVVVAFSCLALGPGEARAGATFTLDGKALELDEVSAWRVPDRFEPDRKQTLVLVTKTAPDREAITAARDTRGAAINDPSTEGGFFSIVVDASGEISLNASVDGVQYLDSTGQVMDERGSLVGSCIENSDTRIVCAVETARPVEIADGKSWTFKASFASDVRARTAGKALPPDGGEAGKTLLDLQKALDGNDAAAILGLLGEEQRGSYEGRSPEEALEEVKADLGRRLPQGLSVQGGEAVGDDEVALRVHGRLEGMEEVLLYEVTMVREEGSWRFSNALMKGMVE